MIKKIMAGLIGMTLAVSSQAVTIFETDMGSAKDLNASAKNLNSRSSGGTWELDFAEATTTKFFGNGTGGVSNGFETGATDFALLADQANGTGKYAKMVLDYDVYFTSPIRVQFDMAHTRIGSNRSIDVVGYAAGDSTQVFRIHWATEASGNDQSITGFGASTNLDFGDYAAQGRADEAYDTNDMTTFTVTLDGTNLTYAVEGLGSQSTTILNSGTELSSIKWEISGASANTQGFWLDNVMVSNTNSLPPTAPNILFIAIDDLKRIGGRFAEDPGNFLPLVYPDPAIRAQVISNLTPNIDQLAADGVHFMRAYCASPACNPSRAALMTGIRGHKTGFVDNNDGIFFREWEYGGENPLANAVTLPAHLRNYGYYPAGTGKVFHKALTYDNDGYRTWTEFLELSGDAGSNAETKYSQGVSMDWGQQGNNSASHTDMLDYRRAEFIAQVLETGANGAISLPQDKPFFLACGIYKPHLPFYATKDLADLFPVSQMTGITRDLYNEFLNDCGDLPPTGLDESGGAMSGDDVVLGSDRFVSILENGLDVDNPDPDGDLNAWKDMLKYYFACTAVADRSVGRLLEGLANSPYATNTIVILWSDHGFALGEKMHVTKFALWEETAGCNFIIRDPNYPQGFGITCQRPVNLVDIYPTVCARLGLPLPDSRITGHDLSPLLANPRAPWNIPSLCTDEFVDSHMVAMDRFKLIRYKGDSSDAELYDHDADPDEYTNLYGNVAYSAEQAHMSNLLDTAVAEGVFPNEQQWSIESWRHGYWGRSTNAGDGANDEDPDDDGIINTFEYKFGTDPLEADAPAARFGFENDKLYVTYPDVESRTDVLLQAKSTTNLISGAWSDTGVTTTNSGQRGNATIKTSTVPADVPVCFLTLEATTL